jgi:hypothetical protein
MAAARKKVSLLNNILHWAYNNEIMGNKKLLFLASVAE